MKRLLVFASGGEGENEGGSGFANLVWYSRQPRVEPPFRVDAVVSNHEHGGVFSHASRLGISFVHAKGPLDENMYRELVSRYNPDTICLSGWMLKTAGLPPARTINIHPGPLPRFGGQGMFGHHVHKKVLAAYQRGLTPYSEVTMHFVNEEYDTGQVFLRVPVPIRPDDTPEDLAGRVNCREHALQPIATEAVVRGYVKLRNGEVEMPELWRELFMREPLA